MVYCDCFVWLDVVFIVYTVYISSSGLSWCECLVAVWFGELPVVWLSGWHLFACCEALL